MTERVLDPVERVAEVLFGLIMVMTITGSLSVAEAGRAEVRTMLFAALGCNVAWGIIDGVLYLIGRMGERGGGLRALQRVRQGTAAGDVRSEVAGALPPLVASVLTPAELDSIGVRLRALPAPPARARLDGRDWLGALGVFLLVFLSTFPVALPFLFVPDPAEALRVSQLVGCVALAATGFVLGRAAGHHPWLAALVMVLLGMALVALCLALGG